MGGIGGKNQNLISAAQIRAARGILMWSQEDLARAANLSIATIRKLELGYISPRSTTIRFIRHAFEDTGLDFTDPDGVRRRLEDVVVYQGSEGVVAFFDDVYHTLARKGGDLIAVCPSEKEYFNEILGDCQTIHVDRMTAIKDKIVVKCILTEDKNTLPATAYCEYRWISKHYVDSVPFYVYDDKYAIIIAKANHSPKITAIQSHIVAEAFRHQFYSMWEKATPLNNHRAHDFIPMKNINWRGSA